MKRITSIDSETHSNHYHYDVLFSCIVQRILSIHLLFFHHIKYPPVDDSFLNTFDDAPTLGKVVGLGLFFQKSGVGFLWFSEGASATTVWGTKLRHFRLELRFQSRTTQL